MSDRRRWSWRRIKAEEKSMKAKGVEAALYAALGAGGWCSNPYCWADGYCKSGCIDTAKARRSETFEDLAAEVADLSASIEHLTRDLKRLQVKAEAAR